MIKNSRAIETFFGLYLFRQRGKNLRLTLKILAFGKEQQSAKADPI